MTHNNPPKHGPVKDTAAARPAREIVSKLSEHEKTVRDQELILSAEKYFGGLSDEEKLLLGLNGPGVGEGERGPAMLKADGALSGPAAAPVRSAGPDWVWAGLTALAFAGIVGWVLAGR